MNRQWLYAKQPAGKIGKDTFQWTETAIPSPQPGEVLVRTRMLSLDPANRAWMMGKTYRDALEPGQVMNGFAIGEVVESHADGFGKGDIVEGDWGWQDYAVRPAQRLTKRTVEAPLEMLIGPLSVTGLTAYFGLLDVGQPKAGDVVLISGAAGATGSVVGQIAKAIGCTAIGIAGGKAKCDWLVKDLGLDGAIDYKASDVGAELDRLCPNGIDVDFENVGGKIMSEVIGRMNNFGRVALCGMISTYNHEGPIPGPEDFGRVLMRRLLIKGFIVIDYFPRAAEGLDDLATWVREGRLKWKDHVVDGLENAASAVKLLFSGAHDGKLLVRVSAEP